MSYENVWVLTFAADGAIVDKTFVDLSTQGLVATADGTWIGLWVATMDATDGQSVWVKTIWAVEVVWGEALAVGDKVIPGATWKATVAAAWKDYVWVVLTPTAADGEIATVFLVRGSIPIV